MKKPRYEVRRERAKEMVRTAVQKMADEVDVLLGSTASVEKIPGREIFRGMQQVSNNLVIATFMVQVVLEDVVLNTDIDGEQEELLNG